MKINLELNMNNKELYIIGTGLGILIPVIVFVTFWWSVAAMNIYNILSVPESYIIVSALMGLTIGIIIDVFYLKKLTSNFYNLKTSFLVLIYLFCSVMAVSFFMGFPFGNLVLGIFAGFYVGRKCHYINKNKNEFLYRSKKISIFTACITSIEALPIGLLVLEEKYLFAAINKFLGFQLFLLNQVTDILIILFLCLMLFLIQFFITKIASKFAYII